MRAIILAAGLGSRLRPYTDSVPKALVKLKNKPLLEYQLDTLRGQGVSEIAVVTGYKSHCFDKYGLVEFHNSDYDSSNMLYSLMKAAEWLDGQSDILVCYGDILYSAEVLDQLIQTESEVSISADLDWLELWSARMDDPLSDAESFIYDPSSMQVRELGKPLALLEQAMAQYIGLVKLRADTIQKVMYAYESLNKIERKNMYMTDFIQHLIDSNVEVKASLINRGWLEVDTVDDLQNYENKNLENLLF